MDADMYLQMTNSTETRWTDAALNWKW